jgi:hypothetical protein
MAHVLGTTFCSVQNGTNTVAHQLLWPCTNTLTEQTVEEDMRI